MMGLNPWMLTSRAQLKRIWIIEIIPDTECFVISCLVRHKLFIVGINTEQWEPH